MSPEKSFYSRLGRLSSIIMILPGSMAAGWLIGYYLLDRYLTRFPLGTLIMTLVGAVAGFYEILDLLTGPHKRKRNSFNDS